jgi:hypothetical protein
MATFNFTFDPGTTVQQMLGFEIAGRVWAKYLTDNVTINLQVGVSSGLGGQVIGGALPGMRAAQSYGDYRTALSADRKSADDAAAVKTLDLGLTYDVGVQSQTLLGGTTVSSMVASNLNMTRSVAKAAGLSLSDGSTALDGYVLFSDLANATANNQPVRWSYDYTRSFTQASNTLDFLSTAIHEIGHVLGFVSGIDQPGWLAMSSSLDVTYTLGMLNRTQYTNPLDLFRYSSKSSASLLKLNDMTYGDAGGAKFFSLDQGKTAIAQFATGLDTAATGDGYQASHWKNGITAMMNPTLSLGQRRSIASIDLRALDVIGWDVASTGTSTPIDLSALTLQAGQSLANRAGQSANPLWLVSNLTASPTQLVANRDQAIYTMMQNSVIYDMTRVAPPSSTSSTTRQSFAQAFQERGLFSTVDELDGFSNGGNVELLSIAISGDLVSDRQFTNPAASTPQLLNTAGPIAAIKRITQIYRENFTTDIPTASPNLQTITVEVPAQTGVESQTVAVQLEGNLASRSRAYSSELSYFTPLTSPTTTAEFNEFSIAYDHLLLGSLTAI